MTHEEGDARARFTADAVARRSYGKLVALLATRTRDFAAAEDALSEAFASALARWPTDGCPSNPEAWLLSAARRKVIDMVRRRRTGELAATDLQVLAEDADTPAADADIPDHRLALLFACAHPAIDVAIRAPLMLQAVLGLDARRIASAFLISPGTMGQRLVRAKGKIGQARIPFRIPERQELPERLDAVLDAIYAAFAEGWGDSGATEVASRRDLAAEAVFLGRLVAGLLPEAPEALGLLALMLYVEARRRARRDDEGEYVPLAAQNPASWDGAMIDEAESLLLRARKLEPIGRYQLEAALQSAHVFRRRTGTPNEKAVVALYDALLALSGSPVVAVNRALAVAELEGPAAGLAAMEQIADARLTEYQPYWAARAELLARTGAHAEARQAYGLAIGLERDPAVRRFLQKRQEAAARPGEPPR